MKFLIFFQENYGDAEKVKKIFIPHFKKFHKKIVVTLSW
jgi:hypothetical protein